MCGRQNNGAAAVELVCISVTEVLSVGFPKDATDGKPLFLETTFVAGIAPFLIAPGVGAGLRKDVPRILDITFININTVLFIGDL